MDKRSLRQEGNRCHFFRLSRELRDLCYTYLLVSPASDGLPTFGKGSGVNTSILCTCRTIHEEAIDILYTTRHRVPLGCLRQPPSLAGEGSASRDAKYSDLYALYPRKTNIVFPPSAALLRMKSLCFELNFSTVNRGECEQRIYHSEFWIDSLMHAGLQLLRSRNLEHLTITLLNANQRKVGAKRIRSEELKKEMRKMLRPFAYLKKDVDVDVDGFDTLEYAEMFEDMRIKHKGQTIPVDDWLDENLGAQNPYSQGINRARNLRRSLGRQAD